MALYLGKDKIAGTKTSSKIGDTLPIGAIIDYDGEEVPANWELVSESDVIMLDENHEACINKDGNFYVNIWELDEGLYKVSDAIHLRYGTVTMSQDGSSMVPDENMYFFGNGWLGELRVYKHITLNCIYAIFNSAGEEFRATIMPSTDLLEDGVTPMVIGMSHSTGYSKEEVDELIKQARRTTFMLSKSATTNQNEFYMCTGLEGMTFSEWVASEYNTLGATINSMGYLEIDGIHYISPANYIYVEDTDVVIGGYRYTGAIWCCFEKGTQVLISIDGNTKNIEDIQPGDQVVSYNEKTGELYYTTVNKLITNPCVTNVAEVILANGNKVRMNEYHPILTTDGYHSITNHEGLPTLSVGDIVITSDSKSEIVDIIRYVLDEGEAMYNLSLSDELNYHNYLANNIVVHNAACAS